jgi:hypothetical protein
MICQQRQDKKKAAKQIAPKKVWRVLTDHQQQQFARTIEAICQQLASRLMAQQEGYDAAN